MGAVPKYKYTDEQVAADWGQFRSLASDYVASYDGNFHLLLEFKERVRAGYDLTVPMVRAVMNCMLRDARVVGIPAPEGPTSDSNVVPFRPRRFTDYKSVRRYQSSYPYDDYGRGYSSPDMDEEEEAVEIQRPRYVDMPLKFKHDYGIVEHKQATVVHRVHPDSYARWSTEDGSSTPFIWWRCKGHNGAHQMGKSKLIIMSSIEAAIHIMQSGRVLRLCLRCRELADAQQVLVDEVLALADYRHVGTADMHPLRPRYSSS